MVIVCLPVDRVLVPANREHMSLEEQLRELLEKLDMTTAMKCSPSRSKRLKLLKKTINDIRNEMSLRKTLPAPTEKKPAVEMPSLEEGRFQPNGYRTEPAQMQGSAVLQDCSALFVCH